MDELTLLRSTRDDERAPTQEALTKGRAALWARIDQEATGALVPAAPRRSKARPRSTWAAAGVATALTGVLIAGNVTMSAESAHASELLQSAAIATAGYANLVAGSGQYLHAHTHASWGDCDDNGCEPNEQTIDVYMPGDSSAEWVLRRDWGRMVGVTGESVETLRAKNGAFYGEEGPWVGVDFGDIPLSGAAAYDWIDAQYSGGSASRDEDNFGRITSILRSGLVPAPQRAALLDALARVPGVTATEGVANFDGVTGIAIGRNETLRAGERREIIIDPATGLVIGERETSGTTVFGWGAEEQTSVTAIETTVVDSAP
ncbi:hypothetical protein Q9S36_17640 [Microbacterium sp. ARD31]|uniref:hypothetical protein n=1 Tax=Microbacterium sp. ARD31 TaxID=2962576 RepID=UPI002880E153|nr:hypothetical protein [Microbacterium sp. ARD31]MDT0182005.1 hypothetical protein [Microbacterium sp. ARD31]